MLNIRLYFFSGILLMFAFSLTAQNECVGEQGLLKWKHWNTLGSDLNYLTHLPNYPSSPDVVVEMNQFSTPDRGFSNNYRSLIQGFITVPEDGNYVFNLTSDDDATFYLSTDQTPDNIVEIASVPEWTNREEYDKYPEQTSVAIPLVTNTHYYFEVRHREGNGGDIVQVQWRIPSASTVYSVIPSERVYDYTCATNCPKAGTQCDDGNSQTDNDQEDGNCNCIGKPIDASSCIGERGQLLAYTYTNITGTNFTGLENDTNFPLRPDTAESITFLGANTPNTRPMSGTRISTYLKVPVSGDYQFNVTGDDRMQLWLSKDENPDNAVLIANSNWTPRFDHEDESTQTSATISLDQNQFYFLEMRHININNSGRYGIFWKTPFIEDNQWRYVNGVYLYEYKCEMACMPEGLACDDGSDLTINDVYDDQCNCAGTPCGLPDCRDFKDYPPTESCAVTDQHSTNPKDSWLSCETSANPNPNNGIGHWIQYDLGQVYILNETHIWNYNVATQTGKGFKNVSIEYSLNGTSWTSLGNYTWAQAAGNSDYAGFEGPSFSGVTARYVLITALDNWDNGNCSGISKITFGASDCLNFGMDCDDGNDATYYDQYDASCNCVGQPMPMNNCGPEILIQSNIFITEGNYDARMKIESKAIINEYERVNLIAGESVSLLPGFNSKLNSELLVAIIDCQAPVQEEILPYNTLIASIDSNDLLLTQETKTSSTQVQETPPTDKSIMQLQVMPNPTKNWTTIHFQLPENTQASLVLYATDGRKVLTIANKLTYNKGLYSKAFPAQKLTKGMYYIVLQTNQEVLTKPLVVIE